MSRRRRPRRVVIPVQYTVVSIVLSFRVLSYRYRRWSLLHVIPKRCWLASESGPHCFGPVVMVSFGGPSRLADGSQPGSFRRFSSCRSFALCRKSVDSSCVRATPSIVSRTWLRMNVLFCQ